MWKHCPSRNVEQTIPFEFNGVRLKMVKEEEGGKRLIYNITNWSLVKRIKSKLENVLSWGKGENRKNGNRWKKLD